MVNWTEMDQRIKTWIMEAGSSIRESFKHSLSIHTKSNPNDLVTNIDKETERFFIANIRKVYPGHRILGEEGQGDDLASLKGIVWIIDPIDGTTNFIHQQRHFAISIGVYENGVGRLGYIYDVAHDELYYAERGKGAYMNGVRLPSLTEVSVEKALIALNATWLVKNRYFDEKKLVNLAVQVRGTRSYGSAALELAYVAAGRLDGYLSMRLSPWDFAAGKLLVEEAGGCVTNLFGEDLNMIKINSVFAGAPILHGRILDEFLLKD
ncbi:inositol monophosphatase family protein [Pseudobacillus badius]|uniref:inositol monophosphatase family protein n=1 Tax=Bacillus badius TaxID=1455 RepID=UPI0007B07BB5|nr:inositol monophosphatase family protein [Bacillus badius]KZO01539.1 inositol monophosphatase [Bacillus badius]MED0667181.1 inositol monophosphatase family protein [Bacillus badius]OCS89933.1 inositol monophosphatase [Bacillus badius]OVE53460.1 inositol monophosphatase [Bacillus badius]TDW05816.1 myo-inositol-1(or 4)-monophosphatase [Bacillus badius]